MSDQDLDAELEALAAKVPAPEQPDLEPSDGRNRLGPLEMAKIIGAFLIVGLFAVGGLFAYQQYSAKPPPLRADSISAKLELAAGEVLLLPSEDGGSSERLLSGTPLPTGAKLQTGAGARALVRLADGSRIFLRDNTTVTLAADTGVELQAGELWLETPPLDRDRDPLTHVAGQAKIVLADGGASVALADGQTTVYVAKGVASVSSAGGRSEVRSGERARIAQDGGAPTIEPVAFWDDWTGGMANRRGGGRIGGGSGALYAVDDFAPPGTPSLPLSISKQTVDVAIQDGLAETRVDQRFFNPSDRPVEGWYWFTVPNNAMLVGFELETDGQLVEGEIVERQQAVATYAAAKASDDNPALLEWIDERTVRARIFPVPAMGERRIVVRYQQLMGEDDGKLRYSYPLASPGDREAPTIEEFSLVVELRDDLARDYAISTLDEATVSGDSRLISMRRSGYTPRADFELELTRKPGLEPAPALRLSEFAAADDQARFVMLRWLPDADFQEIATPRADVVVVVDTSAFGDDAEHQTRVSVAEALLRSLSADDNFAVVAADLGAEVLYPQEGLQAATPEAIDAALAALAGHRHGGATDLGAIFERALNRVQGAEQPAVVYIGDGLATSGERGADALAERLRRALTGSRARLFTVGVGPAVDERLLERLARVGGGASSRVESPEQAVVRALELSGAIKTPTLTDLEVGLGEGLDDRFDNATGKLARGRELVILARTHGDLPETVTIRYRLGGEVYETPYPLVRQRGVLDFVIPKLWAAARIERLLGDGRGPQAVRGKVLALGLEYGLMTPFTSFLALDSEYAYARQGVERRNRPWDRQLLGAVLPHEMDLEMGLEMEPLEPSAGELLLGALSAPMGCSMAPEDRAKQEEASAVASAPTAQRQISEEEGKMGGEGQAEMKPTEAPAMAEPEEAMAGDMPAAPPAEPEPDPSSAMGGMAGTAGKKEAPMRRAKGSAGAPGGGGGVDGNFDFGEDIVEADKSIGAKNKLADDEFFAREEERTRPRPSGTSSGYAGGARLDDDGKDRAGLEGLARDAGVLGYRNGKLDESAVWLPKQGYRPSTTSMVARNQKLPCSDASSRSLSQRKVLWEQRLARSPDMSARLAAYEAAAASCELEDWRQQRVFLDMLQSSAQTEAEVELLIAHFWDDGESKAFLVRALQRRLVDPQLIKALELVLFGSEVDLEHLELAVAAAATDAEALELVRSALDKYKNVPAAERLHLDLIHLDLLFAMGKVGEAIATGRKLRELNLMTPALAERLGELLVRSGEEDEAKRVYSEIVEYDPDSAETRRLLGDIFLRHGWYQEAYRQYGDLVAISGAPEDSIRLARAAAGTGRVDEGLRLLRQVAMGDGRPGVDDPRRWARLHAAALLATMLAEDPELPKDKLTRELKRLQLFDAPTTWTFLLWRDLGQQLVMGPALGPDADAEQRKAAEAAAMLTRGGLLAGDTGLWAVQRDGLEALPVRHQGEVPARAVDFERVVVRWDGTAFTVTRSVGTIAARQARQGDEGDSTASEGDSTADE